MKINKSLLLGLIGMTILTACQTNLPNQPVEISEFIPKKEIIIPEPSFEFPQKCDWKIVDKIVDGDTIYTKDRSKIRFLGINTPELYKENNTKNPDGFLAKKALETMLDVKQKVCLMFDPKSDGKDRYGRLLAYLYNHTGTDISKKLIEQGFAEHYAKATYARKKEFKNIESIAKKNKVGLWEKGFILWR